VQASSPSPPSPQRFARDTSVQTSTDYDGLTNEAIIRKTQQLAVSDRPAGRTERGPPNTMPPPRDENSEDDDDDFETDTRGLARGRKRPVPSSSAPSKRPRIGDTGPKLLADLSPDSRRRAAASSSMPPPPRPGEVDFAALSQRARETTAAARIPSERAQLRTPWSDKDTQILVQAVATYHTRWSIIEKLGREGTLPFDKVRDQQALRDKARLVKQDILK